jgi:CheY-like chemotaxis protein/HPt (histidine-containing phosphotransfer) domain-containing protein
VVRSTRTIADDPDGPSRPAPRLLLIEDHPHAREVMAGQLRGLGWTVEACAGVEALADAPAAAYDVAVVDWPPQDAQQTAALQRLQARDGTRIVGVACDLSSARVDAVPHSPLRVAMVLAKPVIAPTLFDAVHKAWQQDPAHGERAISRPLQTAADRPQRLLGLRLLVVEDNPTNQLVAQGLLAGEGAHVTLAGGGLAGVEAVARSSPAFDAVLMDLQMPDIDGFEATARIRRLPGGAALPVIAMTANAMASDRDKCLRSGMDDHVAKPIDIGQLVQVIQRCSGRTVPSLTPRASEAPLDARPIDVAGAVERMGGDREIYFEVLRSALDDLPQLRARLLKPDEAPARARVAHTIKGLAGTVGAERLREAAWRVEVEFKQTGQWSEGARTAFEASLAEALEALRGVLGRGAPRQARATAPETP